jgi:hypothetical protein
MESQSQPPIPLLTHTVNFSSAKASHPPTACASLKALPFLFLLLLVCVVCCLLFVVCCLLQRDALSEFQGYMVL